MSDFDPASISSNISSEAKRAGYPEQVQEQRREEALLHPSPAREEPEHGLDQALPRIGQGRAIDGDSVQVTANRPQSAGDRQDMTPENARQLARETNERILESPREASEAVRGTAQEPASTRISRAIEALS